MISRWFLSPRPGQPKPNISLFKKWDIIAGDSAKEAIDGLIHDVYRIHLKTERISRFLTASSSIICRHRAAKGQLETLTFDDTAPTEPAIDPLATGSAGEESATQPGDVSRWKQPTGAAWITAVIGALTAALYLWNLDGVGNANSY